jgi:hypothetical protein
VCIRIVSACKGIVRSTGEATRDDAKRYASHKFLKAVKCRIIGDNRAGRDDPKAMYKFEHGEKVIEAQKRIAVPRRQLLHCGQVDGR